MTTLRAAHAAQTRERILDAYGASGFNPASLTHAEVARRAGVSERTVWRHFPTRNALFQACIARMAERMGWSAPRDAATLPGWAAGLFSRLHQAIELEPEEEPEALRENRERRYAHLAEILAPSAAHLDERSRRAAAAVIQVLMSPTTLERWRRSWGLDEEQSAAAVAWAVGTLIENLQSQGGPQCSLPPSP